MKELPPAYREIAVGLDFLPALLAQFGERGGFVQASGIVEDPELGLPQANADATRSYRGRFALAQLGGPVGGPYGVTLSRAVNDGVEVLAGLLLRARSAGVAACCIGTGFVPPVAVDSDRAANEFTRPLVPVAGKGRGAGFAARVLASPAKAEVDDDALEPEAGDLVNHFTFGICEVVRISGDQLTLRDPRTGRTREVRYGFLTLTGPVEHDGKRLFSLTRPA